MRGVLFSLDIFIALALFTLVLFLVISHEYSDSSNFNYLRYFSMDMLSSFEKQGLLAESITAPFNLRVALNALPPNICSQITIINSTNATILAVKKQGCNTSEESEKENFILYRTFYAKDNFYLAKSKTWWK